MKPKGRFSETQRSFFETGNKREAGHLAQRHVQFPPRSLWKKRFCLQTFSFFINVRQAAGRVWKEIRILWHANLPHFRIFCASF